MVEFLKNIRWTPLNILKAAAVVLAALIALAFIFGIIGQAFAPLMRVARNAGLSTMSASYDAVAPQGAPGYGGGTAGYGRDDGYYAEEMAYGKGGGPTLSVANAVSQSMPPMPGSAPGPDAEAYEAEDYSAYFETRDKERVCGKVRSLKGLEYVVFENANERDRGCSYSFKVERSRAEEVLETLKGLDPRELSQNSYTIERQVDDFTSEEETLRKELASIDATLASATSAYEDITALATRTQSVDSLARIIDSRINTIQRLTQQRIDTASRLERLGRAKAQQLDKLDYTYFYVDVQENKFLDGEFFADSWKAALKDFFRGVNKTFQDLTVNLLLLLLLIAQYVLYFFIVLLVAKYVWRAAVHIWKKQ